MAPSGPASTVHTVTGRCLAFASMLLLAVGCSAIPPREVPRPFEAALEQETATLRFGTRQPRATDPLPAAPDLRAYQRYAALNSPALEAAFDRWRAEVQRIPQVTALPDPRFTYRYYIQEIETRVGPQQQAFELAQTFPWFGELAAKGDMATEAALAAQERYEEAKLRLFYRVADAYYEYYYLARAIGVVRDMRSLLAYLESVARARYEGAAGAHPDVIRAQVELGRLDDRLRSLEDLRAPAMARLNAALNRPVGAELPWPELVHEQRVAMPDEEILAQVEEANPELRALEHQVAQRSHGIALARKDYYPDVTVGLNYIDTGAAMMPDVPDSSRNAVIAMVSLNLPIWRQKYRAGLREAVARHQAAVRDKQERRNVLLADAEMVLYKLRDAQRKVDLFRDTLVPKARQSLGATQTAFSAGKGMFLDLIDAQRILLEFELSYERALADQAQRLEELQMLVGRRLPVQPAAGTAGAAETAQTMEEEGP